MRKPQEVTIDRCLLLHLLRALEPYGLLSDVKLQQVAFLCELQMVGQQLKGFHFQFARFPYGAFSKELDNDLTSLRRKERIENFSPAGQAEEALAFFEEVVKSTETNQRVVEILEAVVGSYGALETGSITQAVEKVELVLQAEDKPDERLPIREIPFHSIVLVPSNMELPNEFTVPQPMLARLNTALGS